VQGSAVKYLSFGEIYYKFTIELPVKEFCNLSLFHTLRKLDGLVFGPTGYVIQLGLFVAEIFSNLSRNFKKILIGSHCSSKYLKH